MYYDRERKDVSDGENVYIIYICCTLGVLVQLRSYMADTDYSVSMALVVPALAGVAACEG